METSHAVPRTPVKSTRTFDESASPAETPDVSESTTGITGVRATRSNENSHASSSSSPQDLKNFPPKDYESCPSRPPPRQDMDMMDIELVHERMRRLLWFNTPESLKKRNLESYEKICYLVGQGLDKHLPRGIMGKIKFMQLLSERTQVGKRFLELYNAREGDDVLTPSSNKEDINETFQHYLDTHFPKYLKNDGGAGGGTSKSFTIFDQKSEHPNMDHFYRVEPSWNGGHCFLHAPLLMFWYLALWYDEKTAADDIALINLSRYARNTFQSRFLYKYLFNDFGGESRLQVEKFMWDDIGRGEAIEYTSSYETILDRLQKYGPALVQLDMLPLEDINKPNKFHFTEVPPGMSRREPETMKNIKCERHAMLLVGIRQDQYTNQTFLLLQSWWKGKMFVEVRNDYLSCVAGGRRCFRFITQKFELVDQALQLCAQHRTGGVRTARRFRRFFS